jgi:beta-lactamase regulating signal transducer with metallopeptidase domain
VIAPWIVFSLVTGFALTAAATAADRLASLFGRPRRFIWLTAMVATTCWPVISIIRAAIAPLLGSPMGQPDALGLNRLSSIAVVASGTKIGPHLNAALLAGWILLSLGLLFRLAVGIWQVRKRRACWRTAEVDGVSVLLAPAAGPAVFGFHPMHVVIPEWILDMDSSLRALVLRHEEEHRGAGDPYLLLAATLMTALIPWSVPLWLQARRLRLVIELDCDARVLRAHPPWRQYAQLLLTIAERRSIDMQRLAPALSEPASNLERRITAMRTRPKLSLFQVFGLGVLSAAAFALACTVHKPELTPPVNGFFEFQVESPATLREHAPLVFPAAMKRSGIGGEVWAQFVVDETGRVDIQTFKLLKSPGPEFTATVRAALPTWQYDPATVGGRKVRQLVQQSFVFRTPPGA